MLKRPDEALEQGRIRHGPLGSDESYGATGAFVINGPSGRPLHIVASDGEGWEHVSVSTAKHPPNWAEMCFVKNLFWDDEDCVMQLHPPKSDYINCHPNCLHLWRPIDQAIPMPSLKLV